MKDNDTTSPHLTVIVCSYGREDLLRNNLASLSHQTLQPDEYEVLVVDNNVPASAEVKAIVRISQSSVFSTGKVLVRYLHCPTVGVSHARNAGIAAARGEIVCFVDDDAAAFPDWLEQIAASFDAHPEAGVIGGHIILQAPVPRPKIIKEGLESYWSQFITPYDGYTEIDEWSALPWGANWSARKAALLQIGGFRTTYGRRGNDYGGGEELVAAAEILSLGYKVAVVPQIQVLHTVDACRFNLLHLWRTILSSTLVTYRAQQDLHIPSGTSQSILQRTYRGIVVLRAAAHVVLTVHRWRDLLLPIIGAQPALRGQQRIPPAKDPQE